jgi:hypothetical protein
MQPHYEEIMTSEERLKNILEIDKAFMEAGSITGKIKSHATKTLYSNQVEVNVPASSSFTRKQKLLLFLQMFILLLLCQFRYVKRMFRRYKEITYCDKYMEKMNDINRD